VLILFLAEEALGAMLKYYQNMLKKVTTIGIILVLLIGTGVFVYRRAKYKGTPHVKINKRTLYIHTATSPDEWRTALKTNPPTLSSGLMFVYNTSKERPVFATQNIKKPVDLIWISGNDHVVDIKKNVRPCIQTTCASIASKKRAKYVLALKKGGAEKYKIATGNTAEIFLPETLLP
jgi:uncharacterized membrane protein (UPF0127 family)